MIRLEGLQLTYPSAGPTQKDALAGVDMEVGTGQVIILTGPSGSGKTSLLSLVAGLRRPTQGRVYTDGVEVSRLTDERAAEFRRDRIGFIFQSLHLIPGQEVLETVTSPLLPSARPWADLRRRALTLLTDLDLADRWTERVERLSAGEQQRVAIARAMIADPPVILADEPSAALDQELTARLGTFILDWKQAGKTVLLATHDPALLSLACADGTVILNHGRINPHPVDDDLAAD